MKRIFKNPDSEVILNNIKYKKGDNKVLTSILLKEQKNFCAYTEEYIGINDAADIEHFNPNLKYSETDSYQNWFMVKHKPNNLKRTNWIEPILYPTSQDFEQRLIYFDGYFLNQPEDVETKNLIDLLNLNNEIFVKNRKKYIERRKERIKEKDIPAKDYFQEKIDSEIDCIKYLRAIQEEFNIDIWDMIPIPK
jgi:HNH endonuclease